MVTRQLLITLCLAGGALAACAPPAPPSSPSPPVCAAGLGQPMRTFELFFGRAVAGRGDVTNAEWTNFVKGDLAAALPTGFTVLDARGSWRNPKTGRTIHQATKVVIAVMPDTADSVSAVDRARTAYQTRFNQQLVGLNAYVSCGQF